jgi:hypothetical protein
VNATVAGAAFVVAPDGHLIRMPLSQLTRSPFADFRVPGLLLFVFIGLYPIFAAYGLWKGPRWVWLDVLNPFKQCHWSWAASIRAGAALIVWITVQVQWITFSVLHGICLFWGGLIIVVALLPSAREYCRSKR